MKLSIELASEKDIKDIFDLSNDPVVRQNSINTEAIAWADHVSWFSNKIKSRDCVFFIARNEFDDLVAQVRFDRCDVCASVCVISISIAKDFRGKGLGKNILSAAAQKLFCDFNFNKIIAFIKKDNHASINLFSKVGYNLVGQELISSTEFLKFELCRTKERFHEGDSNRWVECR